MPRARSVSGGAGRLEAGDAVDGLGEPRAASAVEARQDRRRVKELERELHRKDKALAETAALLVLSKKLSAGLPPRRRGRMTRLEDRQNLVRDIEQACADGARLAPACALAGIDACTLRRWKAGDGLIQGDRRPDADRAIPSHALSEAERARIIEVANQPRFADMPPARIVPALADEGVYLASEASFHRVLRAHGQMNRQRPGLSRHGRRARRAPTSRPAPGEVWVLGRHIPAGTKPGSLVLSLPDPGPLQPQGRRL